MLKLIAHIKMATRRSLRQVAAALRAGNRQAQSARLLSYAAMLTLLMLPVSCSMFDTNVEDCQPNTGNATTYLQVKIQVAGDSNTRALGGEDGDGREPGVNKENDVNNVTIFLYEAEKGINEADADIKAAFYISGLTGDYTNGYTGKKEITKEFTSGMLTAGKTYHVLVVANMGDMTSWKNEKLAGIRNKIIENAWTPAADIKDYSNFVMTSESDEKTLVLEAGKGTEDDPYSVETQIERVAARIDFDWEGSTPSTDNSLKYIYNVTTAGGSTPIGKLVLTHVMPFNEMNAGSYCIKRVTNENTTEGTNYLGDELPSKSGANQTNYVIDPYWEAKSTNSLATTNYKSYFVNEDAAKAVTDDAINKWPVSKLSAVATNKYGILDYTQENTSSDNKKAYSTGLIFRGTYYTNAQWDVTNNKPNGGETGETKTYVYYIRHCTHGDYTSDTETDTSHPMLHGIVRNNIYRIKINKVLENGIEWKILVKPWALYRHSDIIM